MFGAFAVYAAGWLAFFVTGNSWWQLIVAAYLGFAFTQVAFLGHDAGHHQVFRRRRANTALGRLCGNLAVGVDSEWWVEKHNRHHVHPNNVDLDPDVRQKILAYTRAQVSDKRGALRCFVRSQHLMFVPLLCLEALWLHAVSVGAVMRKRAFARNTGAMMLGAHAALYMGALFMVLSPLRAVAFFAVHQMVFGVYLGATFATNHKGMATFSGEEPAFLERQVLSSRNVAGGTAVELLLGGLNYQIEHHLFPSMPRPNLRRAREIVRSFCGEIELPYEETGLFEGYRRVLGHLRAVSR